MSKPSNFSLRQTFDCPFFGHPKDRGNNLPTHEDVLRCCAYQRRYLGQKSGGNKEPSFSDIAANVAAQILVFYDKASIPAVTEKRVIVKIHAYHKNTFP